MAKFSEQHPLLFGILLIILAVALFTGAMAFFRGLGNKNSTLTGDKIGLCKIEGMITDAHEVVEFLHELRTDESVKGVLLRIDSPGGSVAPSQELYQAAVEKSGLRFKGMVSPLIDKITKKHGIPTHRPRIEITISDPKAVLRRFRETTLDDAECFRKTLDHLESDLEKMRIRANAWARGDMLTLREVTYEDQSQACTEAMLESGIAREQGIDDLPERVEAAWLEAAETIISERQTSFAALPIGHLVATDGYLAKLAARGYTIEAP